ncbi:MAG TPA: hypothetical protein VL024_11100 [Castellaniella sp.]|nr:hypothetical protein [Castellaniella sp.]
MFILAFSGLGWTANAAWAAPNSPYGARGPDAQGRVPVLSVTHETIAKPARKQVCWQTIVSDRQRAQQQYKNQSWVVKYWKPILGGVLGGLVGFKFTQNFGEQSKQKWLYPTIAAGIGVGAITGPGMVAGAYGLGTLAYSYWPGKLPLVAAISLIGGILGDGLFELLFPDKPSKSLLEPTKPGQYLSDQQFYLETTCLPQVRVTYTESPFRVSYEYQGEARSALVKHYPGDRIALDAAGRPVNELKPQP